MQLSKCKIWDKENILRNSLSLIDFWLQLWTSCTDSASPGLLWTVKYSLYSIYLPTNMERCQHSLWHVFADIAALLICANLRTSKLWFADHQYRWSFTCYTKVHCALMVCRLSSHSCIYLVRHHHFPTRLSSSRDCYRYQNHNLY